MSAIRTCLWLSMLLGPGCNGGGGSDAGEASGGSSGVGGSDSGAVTEDAPTGTLFGEPVTAYVQQAGGVPTVVGVVIPIAAIEAAPDDGPFQDELVLDMPQLAREQTMLWQLRVNWLAHGHGPAPYSESHFDLHFYRGTTAEIDAIDCQDDGVFAAELLTDDHQTPTTCVARMGYHAWPTADALPGAVFTASMILGYFADRMVFIEPMIARSTLLARADFERAISRPAATGGAPTLYPTRMRARWVADEAAYHLEFDRFVMVP